MAAGSTGSLNVTGAWPVLPGERYEEWVLDDPAGWDVCAVRPVRDEIERRVRNLLDELSLPASAISSERDQRV